MFLTRMAKSVPGSSEGPATARLSLTLSDLMRSMEGASEDICDIGLHLRECAVTQRERRDRHGRGDEPGQRMLDPSKVEHVLENPDRVAEWIDVKDRTEGSGGHAGRVEGRHHKNAHHGQNGDDVLQITEERRDPGKDE